MEAALPALQGLRRGDDTSAYIHAIRNSVSALEQAAGLLKQHGKNLSDDELREINRSFFGKVEWLSQELEDFSDSVTDKILAEMAEEERLKSEER